MTEDPLAQIYATINVSDSISASDQDLSLHPRLSENIGFGEHTIIDAELGAVSDQFPLIDRLGLLLKEVRLSDEFSVSDTSAEIRASLPVQESITWDERISYKEMVAFESVYASAFSYIKNLDITTAVETYFPDYFHQQEPYADLIEALSTRLSYNYNISDIIKLVYNIDEIPQNYKNYNALLRLLGINHDFANYPLPQLKQIIRSYLSIRKHRGTKKSLLAMLRAMDPEYLQNPENPCEMELEYANVNITDTITNSRKGILYIVYDNIPPKYSDHAQYMLGKVVPTGLAYKLISKKVKVHDEIVIFDRAYPPENIGNTYYVSDQIVFIDHIPYRQMSVSEDLILLDTRSKHQDDEMYFSESARLEIPVAEDMSLGVVMHRQLEVLEGWSSTASRSLTKYGGDMDRNIDLTFSEAGSVVKVVNVVWVEESLPLADGIYSIEVYDN